MYDDKILNLLDKIFGFLKIEEIENRLALRQSSAANSKCCFWSGPTRTYSGLQKLSKIFMYNNITNKLKYPLLVVLDT
jgi:hypothetical protein